MKSRKSKPSNGSGATSPNSGRSQEEIAQRSSTFTFLKNRFFASSGSGTSHHEVRTNVPLQPPVTLLSDADNQTPLSTSPCASTSSNYSMPQKSLWSVDNTGRSSSDRTDEPVVDKSLSKSYDDRSAFHHPEFSRSGASNARPASFMALEGHGLHHDHSAVQPLARSGGDSTAKNKNRASLIIVKEGYLYKKTDFRPFHKPSKLHRGWKLYRVALRGHKLYLYKVPAESPFKTLFPLPRDHSLSLSLSNTSLASQKHVPPMLTSLPSPKETFLNAEDFDEEAQAQLFSSPIHIPLCSATFTEIDPFSRQHVLLILLAEKLVICKKPQGKDTWRIEFRLPLISIRLEESTDELLSAPTTPRSQTDSLSSHFFQSDMRLAPPSFTTDAYAFTLSFRSRPAVRTVYSCKSREVGMSFLAAVYEAQSCLGNTTTGSMAEMEDIPAILYNESYKGTNIHPNLVTSETDSTQRKVQGGTVEALVHELLFQTQGPSDDYLNAFLLTYSVFMAAGRILELFKDHLTWTLQDKVIGTEALFFRVLDIFRVWCERFSQDVVGEVASGMISILDTLFTRDELTSDLRDRGKAVKQIVLRTVAENGKMHEQSADLTPLWDESHIVQDIPGVSTTDSASTSPTSVDLSNVLVTGLSCALFLSIDPARLAEQIYLFHLSLHRLHIEPLLSPLSFLPRPHVSPKMQNALLFTSVTPHFLTRIIRNHILVDTQQNDTLTEGYNGKLMRTQLLERWIRVGMCLLDLGDLTGWCAVAMGICSLGVVRLKESWKTVDRDLVVMIVRDWVRILADYGLFTQDAWVEGWESTMILQFASIIDMDKLSLPPRSYTTRSLPFFGTIRQTVDRVRRHIRRSFDPCTVNFSKYWYIYDIIQHGLQEWKKDHRPLSDVDSVPFKVVGPLQTFFDRSVTDFISVPHNFKYLQECSLACEPRIFGSVERNPRYDSRESEVAPPSLSLLTFPEIIKSYELFPDDTASHDGSLEGASAAAVSSPSKLQPGKKYSYQSIRSLRSFLDDVTQSYPSTTGSHSSRHAAAGGEDSTRRSARASNRKLFRRRTYSFPPGGPSADTESTSDSRHHGSYLDSIHSKTWLGSLISQQHGSQDDKLLFDAAQRKELPHGEWILRIHGGELILKASTLLVAPGSEEAMSQSTSSGFLAVTERGSSLVRSRSGTLNRDNDVTTWKEDEEPASNAIPPESKVLVTVKSGRLERLVEVLVHGVAGYSDAMKEQWPSWWRESQGENAPQQLTMDEEEYVIAFFTTYRVFCSCTRLLDLLRDQFIHAKASCLCTEQHKLNSLESIFINDVPDEEASMMSRYDWKAVAMVQLRVVNLLIYWMEVHFYDFVDEIEVLRHIRRFLDSAKAALEEWQKPLSETLGDDPDIARALASAAIIEQRMSDLRGQFIRKALSPCYDLKAIEYDIMGSRNVDELYRRLTIGTQSFSTTVQQVNSKTMAFCLVDSALDKNAGSLVDACSAKTLLEEADRSVRDLAGSVTLQDWIQTFDVFEVQSGDLYAWLPARKASRTSVMSSALSPVTEAPSAQQTNYHIPVEDVIVSDIFTAIEGARRSIVSPSAFSVDDLLLAFPSSIQYLYCMHFIIRSWVIHEITARQISFKARVERMDKFLQMLIMSKAATERMALFPELKASGHASRRVPGFIEYAVASALMSPEVRLFSKAWNEVSRRHNNAALDTLENLLQHVSPTESVHENETTLMLVPSLGWIFERMLELCVSVPNAYGNNDDMLNFDKRRYVFYFLQLVMNAQIDLQEASSQQDSSQPCMSFIVTPNAHKMTWKEMKDYAHRENKTSGSSSGSLVSRSAGHKSHSSRSTVFGKLVMEQLEKLKCDIKERDRIDREWRDLQQKLQKKQVEQARNMEKQERRNQKHHQHLHLSLQQQHYQVLPKINSFLRGLRPISMAGSTLATIPGEQDPMTLSFLTTKASTVINLIHSTTSVASAYTKRDFVFRVVTEEGGQYLFQSISRDEMYDWMQHINNTAREGAAKRQSVLAAESLDIEAGNQQYTELPTTASPRSASKSARATVYGVDLPLLMSDGHIPIIAEKCMKEIEARGLEEVGIYRVAGTGSIVTQLKREFNRNSAKVNLSDPAWADINVVADAFKQFLRELPEPVLTHGLYDELINASAAEDHDERVYLIKTIVKKLPLTNYTFLKRLIEHFVIVTDFEATNHMYATNLAIVFGPTLLQPAPGPASFATTMSNLGHHQNIVKYLILNYHYIFDVENEEMETVVVETKMEEEDGHVHE
ncbi:uncharacterized protein BYT42DRAFT_22588 [Radiomyces spectabilis]|uniref:uncharacterized protein n=1 Tax=Radiomyces spectabilis TaxID=64574 RepID=UPI00221E604A|nr:uncharacterized protein BYT42DRAFT_22588 [Radiomyces spectabilis]KAI8393884.1 hypothetical protein BYT42DRAFT_22588 [Radiomyces spectabilis]